MPLSYYRAPQQSHQSCWQKWDSSPSCHLRIAPVCRQGCIRESWLYSQLAFRNHYSIAIEDAFFSCFAVLTWQVTLISIPTPAAVASFSAFCRRPGDKSSLWNSQGPTCCKISLWPASKCELEKFVLYGFPRCCNRKPRAQTCNTGISPLLCHKMQCCATAPPDETTRHCVKDRKQPWWSTLYD